MKKIFIIIYFLIGAFFSHGQNEVLSIEDCIRIAIQNNLEISQTSLDYKNSLIDYKQSKLERLPSLNANSSHSLNFGRSLDYTSYSFNTNTTQANNVGVSLGASIYEGGRVKHNIKLSQLNALRQEVGLKTQEDQLAMTVARNYLSAVQAKAQVVIAENQVKRTKTDVERTSKLILEGASAGSTLFDINAQLSNVEYQLQQATNSYDLAILQLKHTMQMPFDTVVELKTDLEEAPTLEYLQGRLSPTKIMQDAFLTNGAVIGAEQEIMMAETRIKLQKSQRMPRVSFSAGMNTYQSDQAKEVVGTQILETKIPVQGLTLPNQNPYISFINTSATQRKAPFLNQLKNNLSQNLGVSVQFPIFNRFQVKNQIKKAKNNYDRAMVSSTIQKRRLEQQIQTAYLEAELAYKAFENARLQEVATKKAATFARKRYEIGSASIYDYVTAQNTLANASSRLVQAKYEYIYKVKILEFYKNNQFKF